VAYGAKIGKLEKRILRYTALHSRQNTQVIQRSLGIPDRNYGAVLNACGRLRSKGLLEYETARSVKNVEMKLWFLTPKGENHVLLSNPDFSTEELDSFVENYSEGIETRQRLKDMHKDLGTELALKLLSAWAKLGNLKQKGTDGMAQLMIVTTFLSDVTKDEARRLDKWHRNISLNSPKIRRKVRRFLKKRHFIR